MRGGRIWEVDVTMGKSITRNELRALLRCWVVNPRRDPDFVGKVWRRIRQRRVRRASGRAQRTSRHDTGEG